MKKLLCLLLTLAMTLSFAACGSKADDKTPEEDDPTQAETNIADKQDEPAADDVDKDDASDATEIEPDANKGEKPDEAQKPAEPTKSDSKKDETPASKPSEPAKPAEPSKPRKHRRKHRRKHLRRRTPARSHCSRLSGARTARMTNFPPRAETQSTASTTRPAASMCRTLTT